MPPSALGNELRERRRALGMTQARLADLVGVRPSVLGGWEHGESSPSAQQVQVLSQILLLESETTAAWLEAISLAGPAAPSVPMPPPVSSTRRAAGGAGPVSSRILGALGAADPFGEVVLAGSQRPPWWQRLLGPLAPVRSSSSASKAGAGERGGRRRSSTVAGVALLESGVRSDGPSVARGDSGGSAAPESGVAWRPYWEDPEEQRVYLLRWMGTLVVLGLLAAALVWAFIQLGAGWTAFLDLFRRHETTSDLVEAAGVLGVLASG